MHEAEMDRTITSHLHSIPLPQSSRDHWMFLTRHSLEPTEPRPGAFVSSRTPRGSCLEEMELWGRRD